MEACELTAVEARRLIGGRLLSPVELLDSCLHRIERVNPRLNAFVATCLDRARDEARRAEAAVVSGDLLGPLHGLPIGIKDLEATTGLRTTYGSPIYQDHVPERDERSVAALRAAGAIVIGKTNTPEFGAGGHTTNLVYGPTRNPFDPARTSGGSSGGSAVAVATGMVPLATGSDFGGSLRNPAAFCGVVGFRPSPGTIPVEHRPLGWSDPSVYGPIARTVADAALLLSVQSGADRRDPLSVGSSGSWRPEPVDLGRLRVGWSADLGGLARLDRRIGAAFEDRVRRVGSLVRSSAECRPDFADGHEVFNVVRAQLALAAHLDRYRTKPDLLGPNVTANVKLGLTHSAEQVAWAQVRQTAIFRSFQALFDDIDVLITPTVAVPPFPVEHPFVDTIDGVKMPSYVHWVAPTYLITLTLSPAISIPCGYEPTGTPFHLQIVAPIRQDRFLLGVAHAFEQAFAGDPETARPVPAI
jgi:amidase